MKYIVFVIIAFLLWMTAPMWMVNRTGYTLGPIDDNTPSEKISLTESEKKQKTFIEKYGHKPRIDYKTDTPYIVKAFWKKQYKHPEKIEALRCTPLKKTDRGWMTICNFRTQDEGNGITIQQEKYYIQKDTVTQ